MSDNIDLKLLGRRLETIQIELREIKINIAVDRDRFDSLAQVIGKQLGEVEARSTSRFDILETLINDRDDHSETQFVEVGTRLDKIETRLGKLETQFAEVGTRFDRVETQLTHNTERMNQLIARVEVLLSKG